ncbi:Peptidase S28 family-containing protein [Aphelenchoides besseyi]|nr:Peptidase S28 family-containing protein [Aphelenchoides besseyi]
MRLLLLLLIVLHIRSVCGSEFESHRIHGIHRLSFFHYRNSTVTPQSSRPRRHVENDECDDGGMFQTYYQQQPVDHFNANDKRTYLQRYHIRRKYFNPMATQSENIILVIGGEGEIGISMVCNDHMLPLRLARENKALLVQIEHRAFGKSRLLDDLSVESLQYLTSDQALADLAHFIRMFIKHQRLRNPKIVAYGASYPGLLSARMRVVYPTYTQGNVASSAPLMPSIDFYEYSQVVENAIYETDRECHQLIQDIFDEFLRELKTPEGLKRLNRDVHFKPPIDPFNRSAQDLAYVAFGMYDTFQSIVQTNYVAGARSENGQSKTIEGLCLVLKNPRVTNRMRKLSDAYLLSVGSDRSFATSYAKAIRILSRTSYDSKLADLRAWMWICCNELGFFQTTNPRGIFKNAVLPSYHLRQCHDMFQGYFTPKLVAKKIRTTALKFGDPEDYPGTNVVFVHGSFDPWHPLGVFINDPQRRVTSIITPKASHCADAAAPYRNEPPQLNRTRQRISSKVRFFFSLKSSLY